MDVAVSRLPDRDGETSGGRGLPNGVHLHVEACQEAAGHVERRVAVGLVTLNASPHAPLLAYATTKFPPGKAKKKKKI